jgi:hypothetical protein
MKEQDICANCGERFERWRSDQRYCSPRCHYEFHLNERRKALALYRRQQQHQQELAQ